MSISRWGKDVLAGGFGRWGFAALVAGCAGLFAAERAQAQQGQQPAPVPTIWQLIGKAMPDMPEEDSPAADRQLSSKFPELAQALKEFKSKAERLGREDLEAAKKKHAMLPPVDLMEAMILSASNQRGGVLMNLEKCVKETPTDPEAYLVLADLALNDRRFTEADLLYAKAALVADKFEENHKRKADCQLRALTGMATVAAVREDWAKAEENLQAMLKLKPTAAAHEQLGRVYFMSDPSDDKQDGGKKAYQEFEAAAAAAAETGKSTSFSPDVAIARLYDEAKNPAKAEVFLKRAIAKPPAKSDAQVAILMFAANWAVDNDKPADALKYAEKAIEIDPTKVDPYFAKGVAARLLHDPATAEASLKKALELDPANFDSRDQLAQVLVEQDADKTKQQQGLGCANINVQIYGDGNSQAAKQYPARNIESAATLAWGLWLTGDKPKAVEVLRSIGQQGGLKPDSLYYLARITEYQGQTEQARDLLQNALEGGRFFVHKEEAIALQAKLDKNAAGSGESGTTKKPAKGGDSGTDAPKADAPAKDNAGK